MGDGGVACVPSQHIMEQISISETFCGGKNGKFNSKLLKFAELKMMMKLKKEESAKGGECGQNELGSAKVSNSSKDFENGQVKEEVEEGELGSLKWSGGEIENGEFIPEKPVKFEIKSEIEKGEFVAERWKKADAEKDDFSTGRWRKGDVDSGEFSSEKFRKGEHEKTESGFWRVPKDEVEKRQYIPERLRKSEVVKNDNSYSKIHRYDSSKDKVRKCERTPPSAKYSGEEEFCRSGSQLIKRSSRLETYQDRNLRISSKIVDEESSLKNEYYNGKSHGREHSSGNRLKRRGPDSDSSDRRRHGEFDDYTAPKSRRISDGVNRSAYSEQYQRTSVERSYRNSFSGRNNSSDRYSSRQYESSLSARVNYDRHNSSPRHTEWSPRERDRYHDHRDRSPARRDRSPYDRKRYHDNRNRSPSYSERSPHDQSRYHDRRDGSPNFQEHSPHNRGRSNSFRETNRKSAGNEKRSNQHVSKGQEEKLNQRNPSVKDSQISTKESENRSNLDNGNGSSEKIANNQVQKEKSHSPSLKSKESSEFDGTIEELPSMEEDMDICDTPPHANVVAGSNTGKWFYLDHFGVEQGPSRLCDLKIFVEDGILVSDHLIKHLVSDRWVTVENAVSPLVTSNFSSIISDSVTQLASPPEAPGNLLADIGDVVQSSNLIAEDTMVSLSEPMNETLSGSKTLEDLHIDERVGALLDGCTIIPGKELETVSEVLQMRFGHGDWERLGQFEGFTWHYPHTKEHFDQRGGECLSSYPEFASKENAETSSGAPPLFDNESLLTSSDSSDWFPSICSCKGGDWRRNDEASQDRLCRKKEVLNDGYPLCQMPKSGYEDPRWHQKDELYHPSRSRRLNLPPWAFSLLEELNDLSNVSRLSQAKPVVSRGLKGTMLPVIRINTCVVKDHGSFVSEPRIKVRGKDRHSSRSSKHYPSISDAKRLSEESVFSMKNIHEQDSQCSWRSTTAINIPKDRLCNADDLQLHIGDWYYFDGAGHEQGPFSSTQLQVLVDQGTIHKHSSVFRKVDRVWVPVTSAAQASQAAGKTQPENNCTSSDKSALLELRGNLLDGCMLTSSFHTLHPQFIGYTRGKLHELVMKSYKSREFAAAINEVLDPWINAHQPRKETEKHIYNPYVTTKFQRSDQFRAGKRTRFLVDGSEEDYEMEEDILSVQNDDCLFDDLCGDARFYKEENAGPEIEIGGWGLLDGHVLARVFHFLRVDINSLVYSSLTCKHWRYAVKFYKDICRQADLSSVAPNCTNSMILNILDGYNKENITSLVLRGCTNITSGTLEEVLGFLPSLSCIDIRGCSQFEDLAERFPNIHWVKNHTSQSRMRSLKHISERASLFKTSIGIDSQNDESSGLRHYFESLSKRDTANQSFRQSLYKRSKPFDARRSSSILSRGAHLRCLAIKKSENGYKKMEEFLALSLKYIMKENSFDFFVPKVAEIEYRMKNGYYAGHGLSSVKEDISRMCRDAMKAKNRGDVKNMNRIMTLFIRLAASLEGSAKSCHERDEMMKMWRDGSPPGFSSPSSKNKKVKVSERKYTSRSNGSSYINDVSDYGDYVSDREIKRRLSKLNKKHLVSGTETSDRSSEETETDSDSTASDTESDMDLQSEGAAKESKIDGQFSADDELDSLADDREWGARMTKASLVPPVTRKYEVIDRYVIVADHEEVQRKMQVSLPDDYAEKLDAQKNGTEESDMEIPEVKDYKPRKQLGDEVIEQEVYGIDPYTHNLLLDSMPEESDWPLLDKHLFIEDVLLRTLNRQVRSFTGTGNTPMKYPLEPVIEDVLTSAAEHHDTRTVRVCQFMLNAIKNRPEDNYVAYRKGLGVVCNKEGGFGEDDFVVEFLGEVYPAWKWFEKQDGIRSLQKNSKDPAPEFYNIYLERPKGDADGYDLVVVDAMHKANYASRICHSCRPNCEAKVTAVDGQYQIGIYTVRPIGYGEEVTFDYNSVTESKEEYEASVCLCGSQVCRGSYLNLTGEGAFQKVLKECHGVLDRHHLMLEACELNSVSEDDYIDLGRAGLGSCLLGGLPHWLIAYAARLVRFINFERVKLPEEILRHNLEEKRKYFAEICLDVEKNDAEVQAEGVYNQRLQNLALTLDKVRYVMRYIFGDPEKAPPPLERLSPEEAVSFIWKGEGSLVGELLQCMAPHMEDDLLKDLKSNICAHDPSGSDDTQRELRRSLIWLRDEVRNLPCTYKCRHDAAADLIHIYAYTKCHFRVREYKAVTSPPVYISPLDLGPKYSDKLASGFHEYCKTYGENYCLGQLIYWHNQTAEPDCNLARASRGCLSLPDIGSFYAKVQKPSRQRIYGPRTLKFLLARMEKQPHRAWPKDRIWSFENSPKVFGSPMLDAVLQNAPLDKEMVHWLKHRPPIFQAMWDR